MQKKFLITLLGICTLAAGYAIAPVDAVDFNINVIDNVISADNSANIEFNTSAEAECMVQVSDSAALVSNATPSNASIIQYPDSNNDGRAYYVAERFGFSSTSDYFYQVSCDYAGQSFQSDIYSLPQMPSNDTFEIKVIDNKVNADNSANIQFNSNKLAACTVQVSESAGTVSSATPSNANVVQYPTSTNDGRAYYDGKVYGLKSNTNYYYQANCEYNNKFYSTDVYMLAGYATEVTPASNFEIKVIDNKVNADNSANIQFNSNKLAACTVQVSESAGTVSSATPSNANVVQYPTSTNDGRAYYDGKVYGLKSNTNYYYQANCEYNNKLYSTDVYMLAGYATEVLMSNDTVSTYTPDIKVIQNKVNSDNTANVQFNTDKQLLCSVQFSDNAGLVGTSTPVSTSIVQYGTATNDGRTYYQAKLNSLKANTDYFYQANCEYNNKIYSTDIYNLAKNTAIPVSTTPDVSQADEVAQPIAIKTPSTPNLGEKHKGKLFLQVEQAGRIWYVNPSDAKRYEVTFANALPLFQEFALGISNDNLEKIKLSPRGIDPELDSDKDGYSDVSELENGFNPYGVNALEIDEALSQKLAGKLLLQTQNNGRIWYVDFEGYRHEVTWTNLLSLFQALSIGITNDNLEKIHQGQL